VRWALLVWCPRLLGALKIYGNGLVLNQWGKNNLLSLAGAAQILKDNATVQKGTDLRRSNDWNKPTVLIHLFTRLETRTEESSVNV
jgi:hypothetical protein